MGGAGSESNGVSGDAPFGERGVRDAGEESGKRRAPSGGVAPVGLFESEEVDEEGDGWGRVDCKEGACVSTSEGR